MGQKEARQRAETFIQDLGLSLKLEALDLGANGICGFQLLSGNRVIFYWQQQSATILCQLSIDLPSYLPSHLNDHCYRQILARNFYINPQQQGLPCLSAKHNELLIHWHISTQQAMAKPAIFCEDLLNSESYWHNYLQGLAQT